MIDENLTPAAPPAGLAGAESEPTPANPESADDTGVATSPAPSADLPEMGDAIPEAAPGAAEATPPPVEVSPPSAATEPTASEAPHEAAPTAEAPQPPSPPEPTADRAPVASGEGPSDLDSDLFEAAMAELDQSGAAADSTFKKLQKGERLEATVIQVEADRVFVDLGTKAEGVVPLGELTEDNIESAHGHVKVGDKIQVVVLRPEGSEGNPIVSKKRADFEEAWDRIIEAHGEQKLITAQVVDRVKGGLVVDIGVRGFVPATHVGNGKLRNIDRFVGQTLNLKILEIDRERRKVVLSNRLAEEERRAEMRDQVLTKVAPGDILEGTVRRLTDYGAFVDLGGIDGLLHISEMSWMRISHPREVLKEGQKIKVMVLRLDAEAGKISLGLRQVLPDPWNLIRENYRVGQKITCKIGRMVQSGAFVRLPEGAEAFLPIGEISNRRIGKPSDVLTEGQEVELTIIDLRPDERRMVTSLRGGAAPEPSYHGGEPSGFGDDDMRGRRSGHGGGGRKKRRGAGGGGRGGRRGDEDDYDTAIVGRVPTGGATIGERLGMLKGFQVRTESDDLGDGLEPLDESAATEPTEPAADSEQEEPPTE